MKNLSIRAKITLASIAVLISGILCSFIIMRLASVKVLTDATGDMLKGTVAENADMIAYVTVPSSEGSFYIPYLDGYLEIDEDFMDVINDVSTGLYSGKSELLYGENPIYEDRNVPGFDSSAGSEKEYRHGSYLIYDKLLDLALPSGEELWIRGVVSTGPLTAQLDGISRLLLLILPILAAAGIALTYMLTGRTLKPLRKMTEAASGISEGKDLTARIDIPDSGDEVGRLSKAFNEMLDRLERSFEAERQFTSDASHELRTPTSVILAQSEYILEKDRSAEQYREGFEVVLRQARRMKSLVDDMLDYTRLTGDPERYTKEPVDLSALAVETCSSMELVAEKGISLETEVEEGIVIDGNRLLLTRFLQNLISNAYRYGNEGGTTRVKLVRNGGKAVLSVSDNGIGIPADDLPKIFDRMFRSDRSRTEGGTGLGLPMVKQIALFHGTDVEVTSREGEGTTFTAAFDIAAI